MPNFRRGAAAIEEAAKSKGGGSFRPFVPQIKWKDDKEEKFLLFLNPIEQIPVVQYHDWIPVGTGEKSNGETFTRYEDFISRKDPAIGEDYDDLTDRLDMWPKERQIAVAVELEPVIENVKGRPRPVGFAVKTETFTRKDQDGNETEVTAPALGLVIQASANFFGWLVSYDASQGPIEETAFQVIRRGKDQNTSYDFIPCEGRPVDLSGLMDNLGGINYLEDILSELDLPEDAQEAAVVVANALLDKRLEELADGERYEQLVSPIDHIESKFPKGKKNKDNGAKRERPARPSKRAEASADGEATDETPKESKASRFAKLRAQAEATA
jgi:hypothetical protein